MRTIFLLPMLFMLHAANAQSVTADPSLGQVFITTPEDAALNLPPAMPREAIHKLKLPLFNLNTAAAVPAGSTKIKIGLGSKMALDPAFDLAAANTSAYFTWTQETQGGQVQLTGDQTAPLPAGFTITAEFLVKGIIQGTSTITANFLVTNHNTPSVTLSDENGANNISSQFYIITETVPVTFSALQVTAENCLVTVNFTSENEVNLNRYVIEYSADGTEFYPAGQLPALQSRFYQYRFQLPAAITASVIYVRVKAVDNDASFQYSVIKAVRGVCGSRALGAVLFPNPVSGSQGSITIAAKAGNFNGLYHITLIDAGGKKAVTESRLLNGVREFNFNIAGIAAGSYRIRLQPAGGNEQPVVLTFHKLN